MNRLTILILVLLFSTIFLNAQINIGVKLNTATYQFSDTQQDIVKRKLSSDGKIALEPGVIISLNAYASSRAALHISQAFIFDKASHLAGASSVMLKFMLIKSFKHSFYISLGPVFHYRQSWKDIDGYKPEKIYHESDDWQYKFSWLSGKMEYNYYLNKMNDLSFSIIHIQAESIGFAFGIRHWINKKPSNKKRHCISCPSFH